jgi:N-acetylmuramoyl-L-alanine amidase
MNSVGATVRALISLLLLYFPFLIEPPEVFSETVTYTTNQVQASLRYYSYPDYTRIVLESSRELIYSTGELKEPERVFVDINKELYGLKKEFELKDSIVKKIRIGQPEKGITRIVIDLNGKADFMVFPLYEPFRIVIDIIKKDEKEKKPQLPSPPILSAKEAGDKSPGPQTLIKPRIVLDPGHGGHDPGAIGKRGLKEKDVNLDIALRVRELLKDEFEVFMTRDRDVFISLDERTAFANSKNADLFVSIHTNSNRKKNISGVETYFLNWTDDEEALKVAARENGISLKAMKNFSNFIDLIRMDLEAQAKREESMKLALTIHTELKENSERPSNGIKKGPFYVLYTAKMPCVLVEVSYISNPEEERLLSLSTYRERLAIAIAQGIKRYFELKNRKNAI